VDSEAADGRDERMVEAKKGVDSQKQRETSLPRKEQPEATSRLIDLRVKSRLAVKGGEFMYLYSGESPEKYELGGPKNMP